MKFELPIHHYINETKIYHRNRKKASNKLYAKFKDKYLWHKAYYISDTHKLKVCCKSHGFFNTTVKDMLSTKFKGCPKCVDKTPYKFRNMVNNVKYTNKSFLETIQISNPQFIYDRTKFTGFDNKVTVKCPKHGYLKKNPHTLLTKTNCPKCSAESTRLTTEQFVEKAKLVHGDIYDYSKTKYINARQEVIITCKTHGDFKKTARDHYIGGNGCPKCSSGGGFDSSKPGILYYLSIDNGAAYKIGITNHTVSKRYASDDLSRIKIIQQWYYDKGYEARDKETEIVRQFKDSRVSTPLLNSCGTSELFTYDILGLDTT